MRIYIAGPMRGYPKHNFPAFDKAAEDLRREGHEVVNPADLDRCKGIFEDSPIPNKSSLAACMRHDLYEITRCDAICLLLGWEKSTMVRPELTLAIGLGHRIILQRDVGPSVIQYHGYNPTEVMALLGHAILQAAYTT